MSSAPAEADAAPAKGGKKKLIIIIAAAALVLAGAGGGAWFFLGKKKADADADEEDTHAVAKADAHAAPPTFLPLDNMVVNLADPGGEKFAQIGVTLEISDPHVVDKVKAYMPAIRNGILMVVSQHQAQDLLQIEGKEKLAFEIRREVSTPLGFEVEDPADAHAAEAKSEKPAKGAKKKKPKAPPNPITRVLFSSFIVQ